MKQTLRKGLTALLAGLLAVGTLTACDKASETSADTTPAEPVKLKIGATIVPHSEVLAFAKPLLAEKGVEIEIVEFTDYVQPMSTTENGEIDANYFAHRPYINDFNAENGTHIIAVGDIHYEPFGIYPGKTKSLDDLKDGASIAVPNDTTNEARALLLLQEQGLIKLKDGADLNVTKIDIVENPKNLDIVELEAAQLPRSLQDVDLAVINGNYALEANLNATTDALALESANGTAATTFANVIAVKEGHENDWAIKTLVEVLKSDEVKNYILTTYEGAGYQPSL
ncbi:MAG: MetQ/NlpA family ABC transporter substrate-binding protein [Oscillospiraceae bacterium]|jgi:D-methionine transport system substrate-binding protein|nr:MetQ/NlpA family ABC transporter substrate-binding protein [Oscillospiraceae bacterium]